MPCTCPGPKGKLCTFCAEREFEKLATHAREEPDDELADGTDDAATIIDPREEGRINHDGDDDVLREEIPRGKYVGPKGF